MKDFFSSSFFSSNVSQILQFSLTFYLLQAILMKAGQSPNDGSTKQVASHNKICQNVSELIRTSREEWDIDTSRGIQQTSSAPDTAMLIAAISK